ncbi:MAG: radical SAM protein [Chloroflexota bacterium]|nr:radical SAM protein [Chloroflexota bacterium]
MDNSTVKPLISLNNVPIPAHRWKLWIYTNYDCNLRCSYCVAKSSPNAPRRSIGLDNVKKLVDEAVELGIGHIFFTGGEPFLLPDIYGMLAYSSARVETTVLTNAMLFQGKRLEKLQAIANPRLEIQVSLDGGRAEDHDAYRGKGTWESTVAGIRMLQEAGFRVRLSTTETPANSPHMDALHAFRDSLGIPAEHHFIRPLAKRGYSKEGMALGMDNLSPELTVNIDGVFWHPLSTDADMQVAKHFLPLKPAMDTVQMAMDEMQRTGTMGRISFTCG